MCWGGFRIVNGPLARYVRLWVAHVPGMLGTFSQLPRISDPDTVCANGIWPTLDIDILGWEIVIIRELFDYATSDICRKRQTYPFVKTADMHHGTCDARSVMHARITKEQFPFKNILGACTTRNFMYVVRGPCSSRKWGLNKIGDILQTTPLRWCHNGRDGVSNH